MGQSWGPALGARVGRASGFLNMGRNKCSLSRRAARPRHPGTLRHLTCPFCLGPSLFGLPEPPYPPHPAPPSAVLLRPRANQPRPAVCHRNYATSHLDPPFAAPRLSAADTSADTYANKSLAACSRIPQIERCRHPLATVGRVVVAKVPLHHRHKRHDSPPRRVHDASRGSRHHRVPPVRVTQNRRAQIAAGPGWRRASFRTATGAEPWRTLAQGARSLQQEEKM